MSPKRRRPVASKKKGKRIRYSVVPVTMWRVLRNGVEVCRYPLKEAAVAVGRRCGRDAWRRGHPAQLLVAIGNGQFREEATYGMDPCPPRG